MQCPWTMLVNNAVYRGVYTGSEAPYHIIQPPADDHIQIFSPDANDRIIVTLSCSVNITIPTGMTVTWLRNDKVFITQTQFYRFTNSAMLSISTRSYYRSDVFQCVFNNTAGCTVRRSITVSGK